MNCFYQSPVLAQFDKKLLTGPDVWKNDYPAPTLSRLNLTGADESGTNRGLELGYVQNDDLPKTFYR